MSPRLPPHPCAGRAGHSPHRRSPRVAAVFSVELVHTSRADAQAAALRALQHPQQATFPPTLETSPSSAPGPKLSSKAPSSTPGLSTPHRRTAAPVPGARISVGISPTLGCTTPPFATWRRRRARPRPRTANPHPRRPHDAQPLALQQRLLATPRSRQRLRRRHLQRVRQSASHVTLVYNHPRRSTPLTASATRPVPVLLKAEILDTNVPAPAALDRLSNRPAPLPRFRQHPRDDRPLRRAVAPRHHAPQNPPAPPVTIPTPVRPNRISVPSLQPELSPIIKVPLCNALGNDRNKSSEVWLSFPQRQRAQAL